MRALIVGCIVATTSVASADPTAIVIAIDRSAAMKGERLELAKQAVLDVIETLPAGDRVGVVAFAKRASVIVPMGAPTAARVKHAIEAIDADSATEQAIADALSLAATQLADVRIAQRHVVVISNASDAKDAFRGFAKLGALRATVSTVAVQADRDQALGAMAANFRGGTETVNDLIDLPGAIGRVAHPPPRHLPLAVVFVIDRSGSMNEGSKLDMEKDAVRAAIEALPAEAHVAVVAFDSDADVVVPLTEASHRVRISNDVARIHAGGGTNIFTGLKAAYEVLSVSKGTHNQVVLVTDGDGANDGIAELCTEMHAAKIEISAVGIPTADRNLLSMITDIGDGRLYMVEDVGALPKIFMRETQP
jgi:Mg-chelatase subunit ChlD